MSPFHLEYIYGSALIENRGYASKENGGAKPLSDEIVTKAASNHGVAQVATIRKTISAAIKTIRNTPLIFLIIFSCFSISITP